MEKRKESLSDIKLCRFCLTQDSTLTSLYDRSRDPILVTLPLKIMACVSIEVFPSDKMPSYICERCRVFMDICYDFKQICRRADESCLQFVQNGVPISAVKWPSSLIKMFQLTKRALPRPINTVVEGGATIEVSSQDMSENDDEDEETYNVKIDASRDGSKCIKVTPSGEKQTTSAKKAACLAGIDLSCGPIESILLAIVTFAPLSPLIDPLTIIYMTAVTKGVMVRVRRHSSGLGSWPCDQCDSSYSLHQLLVIHKAQKHRARNVQCTHCDAKFFSKYDLLTHQLRHSNEMPFQCVACDKKFKRLILLKRHEKMMHSNLPRHLCPSCPATFLTVVELEAHKKRHDGYISRQHVCTVCDRKFHKRNTLIRHHDVVHGKKQFACEYCPQRFSTVSKLSRHVRAHAGDRAYPCKYCNKSFVKSHHYTRHLRLKHEEQVRLARGASDAEYRCEQCSESFTTQDDLCYHSAIHATQNLTCPLCQEKFENVDAVTTHIRTHVNGIEFMCEYCELVFTSKEKLDAHMSAAHDDEMTPRQDMDESSMDAEADADADDDEDDNGLNVKEEDGHMVVEIKKADGYMLKKDIEVGQTINTNSEDSDVMDSYPELPRLKPAVAKRPPAPAAPATKSEATSSRLPAAGASERISILRKAEAMKRKAVVNENSNVPQKKERTAKVDSTTSNTSSSDKSLRMLEKELQELKRTTARAEAKQNKAGEAKSKRQPVHTSTPKLRSVDERRSQPTAKQTASVEKKPSSAERRPVNKDKDAKETVAKNTVTSSNVSSTKDDKAGAPDRDDSVSKETDKRSVKEDENVADKQAKTDKTAADKEDKGASKEAKGKASKEDVPSSSKNEASASSKSTAADRNAGTKNQEEKTIKNGDTNSSEDNVVRRSTRPSKIKNYASMIRDRTRMIRDEDDDEEDSDEEEETAGIDADENQTPQRKSLPKRQKAATPPAVASATPARRRGRPRKDATRKDSAEEVETPENNQTIKEEVIQEPEVANIEPPTDSQPNAAATSPTSTDPLASPNTLMSPTGQTLKKVPVKALPPGVKPLPLPPLNARPGDLCQMQIGKKMVKVQKIVMTKAEVEAMAKKGLLELKDGTMVLKQGIKLPGGDPTALRSGLVSQGAIRKMSATPTRCTMDGEEA